MFYSHQGLLAIEEERVNSLLARSERRRMLKEARDTVARGNRHGRSWKALLGAALVALPNKRVEPACEPSSGAGR